MGNRRHPATEQVMFAKDELGLEPEQIAIQLDLDVGEVNGIIARESGIKEALASSDAQTPEEIEDFLRQLAISSDNDKVRLEALKYLHAEKKGRNDLGKENLELKRKRLALDAVNVGMNLEKFNMALGKARTKKAEDNLPTVILTQTPALTPAV